MRSRGLLLTSSAARVGHLPEHLVQTPELLAGLPAQLATPLAGNLTLLA